MKLCEDCGTNSNIHTYDCHVTADRFAMIKWADTLQRTDIVVLFNVDTQQIIIAEEQRK